MTTTQEVLTNPFPPFPFFVENPVDLHRNDLPANTSNRNSNLSAFSIDTNPLPDRCHVDHPVRMVVPSEQRERGISPEPSSSPELPERCQFTFSDRRQCTMARSDIHPSLCRYHAEREDQLFGEPGSRTVAAALDLPELYSACRDLTTAAGVNRALGQVFRLLAQRRISRQEAATYCHLAQLLLRSISAMRAESAAATGRDVALASETSPPPQREAIAQPAADERVPLVSSPTGNGKLGAGGKPDASHNRYVKSTEFSSRTMSSYKNVELKMPQNQHLQNSRAVTSASGILR